MYDAMVVFLSKLNKKSVLRDEIERELIREQIPFSNQSLNEVLKVLLSDGILERYQKDKDIELPLKFKINSNSIPFEAEGEIKERVCYYHNDIKLDTYFSNRGADWEEDRPYIDKIDCAIKKGLPNGLSLQELSFYLVGDEKWIYEGGLKLLKKIKVWESLTFKNSPEPLMIAFLPPLFDNNKANIHLIVENKATYSQLLTGRLELNFKTLIFGSGWKIVGNLSVFAEQTGMGDNLFYYFGDLDHEGIRIFETLASEYRICLAMPFYQALLNKEPQKGKANQYKDIKSVDVFLKRFPDNDAKKILNLLSNGMYIPQEALSQKELIELGGHPYWN